MIQIPITNIPNQSLSVNLDNDQYDIRIHACQNNDTPGTEVMAFDIVRNNVPVVLGIRAVPDFPILESRYLEDGNFLLQTMNDDYPDWRQFGITQFLIFATQDELNTLRASA